MYYIEEGPCIQPLNLAIYTKFHDKTRILLIDIRTRANIKRRIVDFGLSWKILVYRKLKMHLNLYHFYIIISNFKIKQI